MTSILAAVVFIIVGYAFRGFIGRQIKALWAKVKAAL
jgi:hypothetical protein